MQHTDPELIDRLASEYVLGTLRGAARTRFSRWIAEDAAVARAVRRWEDRLCSLSSEVASVAPDERVWRAILARTAAAPIASAPIAAAAPPAPRRPRRWRAFALAASVAVLAVAGWLAIRGLPDTTPWQSAAELRPEAGAPVAWRIEFDAAKRELRSAAQHPLPTPASGAHELWALRAGNAPPVSLGVLPAAGARTEALSPVQLAALAAATRLAVSEEPAGGSPTGLPTGRVVLVAPLAPLRFSS